MWQISADASSVLPLAALTDPLCFQRRGEGIWSWSLSRRGWSWLTWWITWATTRSAGALPSSTASWASTTTILTWSPPSCARKCSAAPTCSCSCSATALSSLTSKSLLRRRLVLSQQWRLRTCEWSSGISQGSTPGMAGSYMGLWRAACRAAAQPASSPPLVTHSSTSFPRTTSPRWRRERMPWTSCWRGSGAAAPSASCIRSASWTSRHRRPVGWVRSRSAPSPRPCCGRVPRKGSSCWNAARTAAWGWPTNSHRLLPNPKPPFISVGCCWTTWEWTHGTEGRKRGSRTCLGCSSHFLPPNADTLKVRIV